MKKTYFIILVVVALLIGGTLGTLVTRQLMLNKIEVITETVREQSILTEWEILEMAIAKTESEYNQYAKGTQNDIGIFQITEVYIKEINRILGEEAYVHSEAYNMAKSVEMFNIMQNKHNPSHDQDKAINLHNPGGNSIGYATRVYNNMAFIKKYEEFRAVLVKYSETEREKFLMDAESTEKTEDQL